MNFIINVSSSAAKLLAINLRFDQILHARTLIKMETMIISGLSVTNSSIYFDCRRMMT